MADLTIHVPSSGGKAGRGCNATGSVQVRDSVGIVKQFRFTTSDPGSYERARQKARAYIDNNQPKGTK